MVWNFFGIWFQTKDFQSNIEAIHGISGVVEKHLHGEHEEDEETLVTDGK